MSKVQKAIEISDAKIQFMSLVDKAANKRQFLVTKQEGGQAQFATTARIVKVDDATHYITGIAYEPLAEDAHGNFMTEPEIRKAAYWFAKNGDKVDIQHSFEKAEGLSVVENYVAPCDMTIGETPVVKGTWIITVECANDEVWQAVQKGELTGFSMGGVGKYSEQDVPLNDVTKTAEAEERGFFKKLAKFFGFEVVEKGEVLDRYNESARNSAFWNAVYALEDVLLYHYEYRDGVYTNTVSPDKVHEALADFNRILTDVMTLSGDAVVKAVELPVCKAGKKMSSANKAKLDEICQALSDFKTAFDEDPEEKEEEDTTKKKEDNNMTKAEIQAEVNAAVVKALTEAGVIKAGPAPQATPAPQPAAPVKKATEPAAPAEQAKEGVDVEAMVAKAAEAAVKKTLIEAGLIEEEADPNAPVTKGEVQQIVTDALAPMLKAFSLPQNLNNEGQVAKSDGEHYLHGLL